MVGCPSYKKNISSCIAIHGRKLCDHDNVFTSNYIFLPQWTQCQTIWTTLLDNEVHHNYKESKYNEQLLS